MKLSIKIIQHNKDKDEEVPSCCVMARFGHINMILNARINSIKAVVNQTNLKYVLIRLLLDHSIWTVGMITKSTTSSKMETTTVMRMRVTTTTIARILLPWEGWSKH